MLQRLLGKFRISSKLLIMNLLVCAVFGAITLLVFFSFHFVEENLLETVDEDLTRVIVNAETSRELSSVFAQTNLLLATFYGHDDHLYSEGNRLLSTAHELSRQTSDPVLKELLQEFASRLARLLQECGSVNEFLRRVLWVEQEIHNDLNRVDKALADRIVDMVLQGKDPSILEQLSVMVSGYRESMLRIGKMRAELKLDAAANLPQRSDDLSNALDDLYLRLQTLTASSPDIAGYGQRLSGHVPKYKQNIMHFFRAMDLLKQRMVELNEVETLASSFLTGMDEQIADAAGTVSRDLTSVLTQTRFTIALLSLTAILFLGLLTARFINSNITRPIAAIREGLEAFRQKQLDARIELGRQDEWKDIEQALNTMAAELQQSYVELRDTNLKLKTTHEELKNKIIELQDHIRARKDVEAELADLNYHLEQSIHDRTQALAEKARELEQANRRLTELDTMKSAFLSSVSHELRTPLTSVLGYAKLIRKDFQRAFAPLATGKPKLEGLASRITGNLKVIILEGERLTRLVNDVLDLSRIEEGRIQWNNSSVSLAQLINDAALSVGGIFEDKPDVRLVIDLPGDLPYIHVDPDRMLQVLINLLNNAAKFTHKGEVRIQARRELRRGLFIDVSDTGTGIPPAQLHRIFDKFYQVNTKDLALDKPKGTGLGLAICRNIVEHYGGTVSAASEESMGSVFSIYLPPHIIDGSLNEESVA